jgi:hypothetical protein
MSDEKEKVEVSSSNATDGVVEAPVSGSTQETPAKKFAIIQCKECGVDVERKTPNTKYCDACSAGRKKVTRQKRADTKKAASYVFDSSVEPTKAEAKTLLEDRGLRHPHVIDTVYKLLTRAAEEHQIASNRFLYANGLKAALASYEAKAPRPLEAIAEEYVPGELLTKAELFALYDASIATHEEITFEEFLSIRLRCKSDTFYLGKEVFKNDFSDCHKVWRDFFPQWNALTLPPNYTQKESIDWLASQSEVKDFLLMASRRAFKSSFARLWLVSAIITQPDLRIAVISETRPLAKDNIVALRGFFECTPGFETRFQRLFPEFCIPVGDGSALSLEVPMRRLNLPQSIESSGFDSTVAGKRADVILFDDPISEVSCTNEVQIQKSVNKRDMIVKLKERGGIVVSLGTPYAAKDLYYVMIERSKKNQDVTFAYRVDPAFIVRSSARYKLTVALLPTLQETDIESFLFPEGLPWKELRVDMRNNPSFFMSQNLCIFPLETDAELRCQFEHDELWARVRPGFGQPLVSQTYMAIDRAFSVSKYADLSCLVVGKRQAVEQKDALVVADSRMDRWKTSELVKNIVDMIQQHKPLVVVGEQDKGWQELDEAIRKECMRRSVTVPWIRFIVSDQTEKAKAKRVKKLELPISDGRLWFVGAHWTEAALMQLERFDGVTSSNSHRKDDFPDALAMLWDAFGPKIQAEIKEDDPETKARKEQQRENDEDHFKRQQMHSRMFGNEPLPRVQTRTEWEAMQRGGGGSQPPPAAPAAPAAYRPFPRGGGSFAILPGNMRGNPNKR